MYKKTDINLIKELSEAQGAPGFEDNVVEIVKKHLSDYAVINEDSMRNLTIERKQNKEGLPTVMLDAHSDEVGFIVHSIKANGTMKVLPLGSWNLTNVLGHKYKVRTTDNKYITGVMGTIPPHFKSNNSQSVTINDIFFDIGASSDTEVKEIFKISIGTPIVPYADFEVIEQNDRIIGKAFDCRLGIASLIEVFRALSDKELDVNIIGSLSTQEEMGLRGAKVNANKINPACAIVLECSPADDTIYNKYEAQGVLDKGVQVRHLDASMIANPRFIKYAKTISDKKSIQLQETVRSGGGTNGGSIHLANNGVPTLALATPTRYIHTHYGIASLNDYQNQVKLVLEILLNINEQIIKGF